MFSLDGSRSPNRLNCLHLLLYPFFMQDDRRDTRFNDRRDAMREDRFTSVSMGNIYLFRIQ